MDFAALPAILQRVHPLFWPVLLVNLWRVTCTLHAMGHRHGCQLCIWPDGRVEIEYLHGPRADDPEAGTRAMARGLVALMARNQATAGAALLCGGKSPASAPSIRSAVPLMGGIRELTWPNQPDERSHDRLRRARLEVLRRPPIRPLASRRLCTRAPPARLIA